MQAFEILVTWRMEKKTLIKAESKDEAGKLALEKEVRCQGNAIQGFYVKNSLKIKNDARRISQQQIVWRKSNL